MDGHKVPQVQESTADLYRYVLRRHIVPRFGTAPIGKITPADVQLWLASLHKYNLNANTVTKAYRVLSGVMDGAVDVGLVPRSLCTIKGAGTERHPEMQIATPEQVVELAAAVGPRWEAMVFAAAYSGLRSGKLAGLKRSDIDFERSLITVTRKLGEVNGRLSFGPPKSAAGRRTIGFPSFVARSLAVHVDLYALPGREGLVFPSADGQPMRRSNFRRRVWEPATAEVGMTGFRFHEPETHSGDAGGRERGKPARPDGPHRALVGPCRSPLLARNRRSGRQHRALPGGVRHRAAGGRF